jgi:hypothetical protein
VCPLDTGIQPHCDTASNTCSDLWTCSDKSSYHDGHVCNCNCGVQDPDCANLTLPTTCANDFACVDAACEYPKSWTCGKTYNKGSVCNCECGAYDPDCNNAANSITCTGAGTYTCTL